MAKAATRTRYPPALLGCAYVRVRNVKTRDNVVDLEPRRHGVAFLQLLRVYESRWSAVEHVARVSGPSARKPMCVPKHLEAAGKCRSNLCPASRTRRCLAIVGLPSHPVAVATSPRELPMTRASRLSSIPAIVTSILR